LQIAWGNFYYTKYDFGKVTISTLIPETHIHNGNSKFKNDFGSPKDLVVVYRVVYDLYKNYLKIM
jgi:hypothetical protein